MSFDHIEVTAPDNSPHSVMAAREAIWKRIPTDANIVQMKEWVDKETDEFHIAVRLEFCLSSDGLEESNKVGLDKGKNCGIMEL